MRRRFADYSREPKYRGRPAGAKAASGKSILAVVEGKGTEPIYLKGLRDELQLSAARVVVLHASVTDPMNMVKEAARIRDEQAELSKRAITVPFDEVWVVFDSEAQNHPRQEQIRPAVELATHKGIETVISVPSFEFWLLLHYTYTTASFADGEAVSAALRKFIPDYEKTNLPMKDLLSKIADAVKHAHRCNDHWKQCGGDRNPSTQVERLVESMNGATGPAFRLF
jgi:hypothetical protein